MRVVNTFVDTNVLLYSLDAREPRKRDIARKVLEDLCRQGNGHVSIQVVNEFASNLIKKFGRSPSETSALCANLSDLRLEAGSLAQIHEALRIMSAASISYWDACILASASLAGCRILLTEDLAGDQVIAGVKIVNPFLSQ